MISVCTLVMCPKEIWSVSLNMISYKIPWLSDLVYEEKKEHKKKESSARMLFLIVKKSRIWNCDVTRRTNLLYRNWKQVDYIPNPSLPNVCVQTYFSGCIKNSNAIFEARDNIFLCWKTSSFLRKHIFNLHNLFSKALVYQIFEISHD